VSVWGSPEKEIVCRYGARIEILSTLGRDFAELSRFGTGRRSKLEAAELDLEWPIRPPRSTPHIHCERPGPLDITYREYMPCNWRPHSME
jgi:hypothetical protein